MKMWLTELKCSHMTLHCHHHATHSRHWWSCQWIQTWQIKSIYSVSQFTRLIVNNQQYSWRSTCISHVLLLLALLQLVKARPQKYVRFHLLRVETFVTLNNTQSLHCLQQQTKYSLMLISICRSWASSELKLVLWLVDQSFPMMFCCHPSLRALG